MPWYESAIFYHIFPMGFCGAPERNDLRSAPEDRVNKMADWIPHLVDLGVTAVYLGPVFESLSHGYDTVDYNRVDRRLGTMDSLRRVIDQFHEAGIRVVVDGVFNHVSRSFFAVTDVRRRRRNSPFKDWIAGIDFDRQSPRGDPFAYTCWEGHDNLVELNLTCPAVVDHLLEAVQNWVTKLDIDGLRLDVAYSLAPSFLQRLARAAAPMKPDFWLMGEVVHGDYRYFVGPGRLHSVTNYEVYKGLYSSHNDRNYFEIAHSLDRQFGAEGMYRDFILYNFADNHDVDRVASVLKDERHLLPLYLLLYTMPGIPSLYYGSEWGLEGVKGEKTDAPLRPALDLSRMGEQPRAGLVNTLSALAPLRRDSRALQVGGYESLVVASEQFAFLRSHEGERVVVAVNGCDQPVTIEVPVNGGANQLVDLLEPGVSVPVHGKAVSLALPPNGGRVLRLT